MKGLVETRFIKEETIVKELDISKASTHKFIRTLKTSLGKRVHIIHKSPFNSFHIVKNHCRNKAEK